LKYYTKNVLKQKRSGCIKKEIRYDAPDARRTKDDEKSILEEFYKSNSG
jgi:hypothetical protein